MLATIVNQPPHEEASPPLSKSMSLSSQPSLPSLPSLHSNAQPPPPSLHHLLTTLKGHSSYVSTLFIRDNSLYSGSSDQEIRLWTSVVSSHPSTSIVAVAKSPIKSLLVSGETLFTAHHDRKIRAWQITMASHNKSAQNHCHKLKAVLPTPKDRFVSLFNPKNYVEVRRHKKCTWVHHVDAISGLAVSSDGSLLYSVSWDRTLKVWRTADFTCTESIAAAHHDAINAVTVSRDGHIYTGSADATIKVWRKLPGEKKHSLVGQLSQHRSAVNALALSADGSVLYSGACDRSVVVWEGGGGGGGGGNMSATGALRGHKKAILSLAVAGDLVCSGSADRTVRVWRRGEDRGYTCLAVLEGHRGAIKSLTIGGVDSCNGSLSCWGSYCSSYLVCSGGMDCDIKVWKVWVPSPAAPTSGNATGQPTGC